MAACKALDKSDTECQGIINECNQAKDPTQIKECLMAVGRITGGGKNKAPSGGGAPANGGGAAGTAESPSPAPKDAGGNNTALQQCIKEATTQNARLACRNRRRLAHYVYQHPRTRALAAAKTEEELKAAMEMKPADESKYCRVQVRSMCVYVCNMRARAS